MMFKSPPPLQCNMCEVPQDFNEHGLLLHYMNVCKNLCVIARANRWYCLDCTLPCESRTALLEHWHAARDVCESRPRRALWELHSMRVESVAPTQSESRRAPVESESRLEVAMPGSESRPASALDAPAVQRVTSPRDVHDPVKRQQGRSRECCKTRSCCVRGQW